MSTDLWEPGSLKGREMAAADGRRAAEELNLGSFRLRSMLTAHFRIVGAVTLRDIKTRAGGNPFGFILALLVPLGHVGIMLTIYYIIGRRAPIGTDATIFLVTGALPFIVWNYGFRRIKLAPQENRSLLGLPGVTLLDILLARFIVELVSSALICVFTLTTLQLIGFDVVIFNAPEFTFRLFQSYLFGISFGFFFSVLALIVPIVTMLGFLMIPAIWLTSGTMFIPAMLPEELQNLFWYNPLSQLIDATRTAYYGYYISDYYSAAYVVGFMLISMSAGIILMVATRASQREH